ncbi:hypothetical protein M413DRAFT_194912 [Hebeloma cylindrosporum]|uniref:G-protein coupled receptors family 1 profile domain-containing protein n=1 Tax=Hebeloma cylindrosporum TaxID=76867 RepID=A0A0C3C620_HEBCY|nr:hypothetical protein M413DRAFT_194912 [Hebeloma cylindrosporum h7]
MSMRAYAFSGRTKKVRILLASSYTCLLVVDIWAFCRKIEIPSPILYSILGGTGCFPNYGEDDMASRIGYSMLASVLMDLVSLIVVVVHCVKSPLRDLSLARYFVSQGLSSFAFISIVNVSAAVPFFGLPLHTSLLLPPVVIVSNIVACRLILQLRARVTPTDSEISRRNSFLVRNEVRSPIADLWVIEGPANL